MSKTLTAHTELRYLKGIGPKIASIFSKRGIHTLRDLVFWFPRTYRDQRIAHDFSNLVPGAYVTMYGKVAHKKVIKLKWGNRRFYELIINTPGGDITCKYFRLPYRGYFDSLTINKKVKVSGKVSFYKESPELHHPDIYPFNEDEDTKEDQLIPIYTEFENLNQHKIRRIIQNALSVLAVDTNFITDPLPDWFKKEHNLIDKISALKAIHNPVASLTKEYLQFKAPAQVRFILEEFFLLQLYMGLKKVGLEKATTYAMNKHSQLKEQLNKGLPFKLTKAQIRVLGEISDDLCRTHPMHRLVQGDVGCGKTIVALLASCQVIESGFQCAMMVPTEILAGQHYNNIHALLKPLGVECALLTGKTKASDRLEILEKLQTGKIAFCIGTHALIQESINFHQLGLVIIDEQHRFGASQRGVLQGKGQNAHFLVMTATPIPRSLAMTLYGDLDVSVINELPAGRQSIVTRKTYHSKHDKVLSFLKQQIDEGRQAYIVYPLVEESEHVDLKNAMAEYEKLKKHFTDIEIGLLHGKMPSTEKTEVMSRFIKNEVKILVSTTVIEVGVDVANASVMIIEHAERFGLSQLHQLRGRVGRGAYKSYCILVLSGGVSEEAKHRVSMMEQTSDGFKIAEADLEIRGPGEFLGVRQSGLPEFKIANLVRDGVLLTVAKQAVLKLIKIDPALEKPEHALLKQEMEKYQKQLLPG